jgi:hypothetical protein
LGDVLNLIFRIILTVIGFSIIIYTIRVATGQFVLPRSAPDRLTRFVFRRIRGLFSLIMLARRANSYEQRDAIPAFYAPIALLTLPAAWLICIGGGYTLIYRAWFVDGWQEAFNLSGSSLLTLGIQSNANTLAHVFMFAEAAMGLILVALLIAYLPTMYSAFSKRESQVALLEVRAGSPPSAAEMIQRFQRLGRLDRMIDVWLAWEPWFAELEETHTSLAALSFFRSPSPDRSWITAAGAVLDAASFRASTLDLPREIPAETCIRAGYLALRKISDFFRIVHDPNPKPTDPISITRQEWDEVVDQFTSLGIPVQADRDQAWRDFAGWRVNYDTVLLAIAALTMAPYAPWSSDRSFLRIRSRKRSFRGGNM